MTQPLHALLIEDSPDDAELVARELRRHYDLTHIRVDAPDALRRALLARKWDVVISDHVMPGFTSFDALAIVQESGQDLPFIIISGTMGEELAVEAMKRGAHDYLLKERLARLAPVVERVLNEAQVRRAHREAQALLGKLSQVVEQTDDAVVITDRNGVIEYVNPAFEKLSGYGIEEALGQTPALLKSGRHDAQLYRELWRTIEAGGAFRHTFVNRAKNGGLYYEEKTITPLRSASGEITHYVSTGKDVTGRMRDEQLLQTIVEGTAAAVGGDFMRSLVRSLVSALEVRYAFVAELIGERRVRTVAAWVGSGFISNFEHGLEGTPCEQVCGNNGCFHPSGVRGLFPHDKMLAEMGAESYFGMPLRDSSGNWLGLLSILDDKPMANEARLQSVLEIFAARAGAELERLRAERAMQESEERFRATFNQAAVGIAQVAPDGRWLRVNQKLCDIVGYSEEELLQKTFQDITHPDDLETDLEYVRQMLADEIRNYSMEKRYFRKDGSLMWINLTVALVRDAAGEPKYFISVVEDISSRKATEEQVSYLSTHDALTRFPNRNLMQDRLAQAIAYAGRLDCLVAVLVLDLDRFKNINDTLGHGIGDQVILTVAQRIAAHIRDGDTVARLGGDEFAVVLADMERAEDVAAVAHKILEAVAEPIVIEGHELVLTGSIGISLYPRDGGESGTLLKNADTALYRAKDAGRDVFRFYAQEMNERALERLKLEGDLRHALERGEFLLHYQPQMDLRTGQMIGVEALLRWQPVGGKLVPPLDFIPLAEESGLIVPIGEWALRAACAQNKAWQDAGLPAIRVAVNLSARQFRQTDMAQMVERALRETGMNPACLELEITESVVMENPERAVQILRDLRALKVKLAIDDFGTGYSSLNYLKRFPIDTLKIDRSFVKDITSDPDDAAIAQSVIALAHSMQLRVIAEGVENREQLAFLTFNNCDEMQGYYFSRPLPAAECTQLLGENRRLPLAEAEGEEKRTLLLLDDEENILSSLQRLLRRDGYRILATTSAREAFNLLGAHPVGVVVSDQRMPETSGVEFLSRVKEMYPDTVRMVLSGYTDLQSVTEAINRGAIYKFLTKPWDDEQLRANIREAFRRYEMEQEIRRLHRENRAANEELANINRELEARVEEKTRHMVHDLRTLQVCRAALDQSSAAVLGINGEGVIVLANRKADSLFGAGLAGNKAAARLPQPLLDCPQAQCGEACEYACSVGGAAFRVLCRRPDGGAEPRYRLLLLSPKE